jgi:photosystem II stability/assembly factor-like uncharacterized protein
MKKFKIISTLVFSMFACGFLMGQQNPWDIWMNPQTDDFATIQQNVENYYANIDKDARGTGYKQWKRWEYLQQDRLTDDGKIVNYASRNFDEYHAYIDSHGSRGVTSTYGYWTSLGPTYYVDGNGWNGGIGRVNSITFHPTNASIIWVGCPSGGLWKTTTGGTSWTPLTDGMPRIGVSGMVVNYDNTDIMYLLSGDGDGGDVPSIGVLKTTNGGVTWNSTGLTWNAISLVRAYKILMHPTNPAILFVVSSEGIFKSTNSGSSWTNVHSSAGSNYHDIEFRPGTPATMYACAGSKFYRSTNTGDTWTQITTGVPTTAYRMAIGVSPADADYVYIFAGPSYTSGTFVGMYRSFDSGVNFGTKSTTPNILGYSSVGGDSDDQNTYDHCVAISRTNVAVMVTGAINCWKSTDYGAGWALSSMWDDPPGVTYTHADIHALEINPLNNYLYCGSDGGFFRSTDFGENWYDYSNGLAITQTYRFAGYEPNANLLINGTQDNGSNKWTGGATMLHTLGADGMDCMIDHSNSNTLYNSTQFGGLNKSTDGGASFFSVKPAGSSGSWITPYIMNPANAQIIYAGYSNIFKSSNGGSTWTDLGYDGSGSMAIGTSNTSKVYATVDNSNIVYMSDDAGATFTNVTNGLPTGSITFIAVNPENSNDVFVTYGGYTAGRKVFLSTNSGTSWTNISGTLPNIPVNCIAYEDTDGIPNDALYIGTDVGVYYRDDDIGDWIPFMNGLPAVIVFDLEINEAANVITAATYGRGFWRSDLYSDCPPGYSLTVANDPGNPNYTGFQHYEASSTVTSSRIITGGIGTDVTYKAGTAVTLQQGFNARAGNKFKAILGPCSGTAPEAQENSAIPITGTYVGMMTE